MLLGSNALLAESSRANLEWNQDALVSHADVYSTIVSMALAPAPSLAEQHLSHLPAIDLTKERVPQDRTCASALIPEQHCVPAKTRPRMFPCTLVKAELASLLHSITELLTTG